jgi:hypothetical protein
LKVLAALLILHIVVLAEAVEKPFEQARRLYYEGTYGNKSASREGDESFSKLFKEFPHDPLVKVYYGSERLLEASHTWAIWKKSSLSKEGIRCLDSAVESSPNNLEVRFVRAVTTYNLPSFFGRKKQSEADFSYLSSRVAEAAKQGALEPDIAASALLFYGRICRSQDHPERAIAAWTSARLIAPLSKAGKDAATELTRMQK